MQVIKCIQLLWWMDHRSAFLGVPNGTFLGALNGAFSGALFSALGFVQMSAITLCGEFIRFISLLEIFKFSNVPRTLEV